MNKRRKLIAGLSAFAMLGTSTASTLQTLNDYVGEETNKVTHTESFKVNAKTSNKTMKTTANLNVRTGAGTSYKVIGLLKKSATVTVIETLSSGWSKISYNGKTAYVNSKYLTTTTVSNNTSSDTNASVNKTMKTIANLNIRSGAGTNYKAVGLLKKGDTVTVTAVYSNGWSKISYNGKTAYVSSKYLTTTTVSNDTSSDTNTSVNKTMKTTANLNVRSGDGTNHKVVGLLKKGETVTALEKTSNGWYKIKYGSGYGYVSGLYVIESTISNNNSNSNSNTSLNKVMEATCGLNVRSGAGTNYKAVGLLKKGETVTVLEITSSGWAKIRYNGNNAYVSFKYLAEKTVSNENSKPDNNTSTENKPSGNTSTDDKPDNSVDGEKTYRKVKFDYLYDNLLKRDGWSQFLDYKSKIYYNERGTLALTQERNGDNVGSLVMELSFSDYNESSIAEMEYVFKLMTGSDSVAKEMAKDIMENYEVMESTDSYTKVYGDLKIEMLCHVSAFTILFK